MKNKKGFTLIELLLVIAIIAVLAVTVFVSLDPSKRLADSRNSRRWSDVNNILTAVHSYIVDNNGSIPTGIATSEKQLGTAATGCDSACTGAQAACLDMSTTLAKYLKTIPIDSQGVAATTRYSVVMDANKIITVKACGAEGTTISISR